VRVFENRVLRRIFGPKRDEIIGGWKKLHNKELHNFYSPPVMRTMTVKEGEIGGACSTCRRKEDCVQGFGKKT
jgi:hypothetical protein